jgi:hypothetical protein
MRSKGWLEIAMLGSSSWMPYVPQGVKGLDDDEMTVQSKHNNIFNNVNILLNILIIREEPTRCAVVQPKLSFSQKTKIYSII